MNEFGVNQDILPSVGVSQSGWLNEVSRTIQRENAQLQNLAMNVLYEVPLNDPQRADYVNRGFYSRVESVTNFFRSDPYYSAAPRVHLIFSQEPEIEACNWRRHGLEINNEWMSRVISEGERQGWKGDMVVDFRKPRTNEGTIGSWSLMMSKLTNRDTRPALFIIDGYGKSALENGFLMSQGLAGSVGQRNVKITTLLRYAEGQVKFDHTGGSQWIYAPWLRVGKNDGGGYVDETRSRSNKVIEFDPHKAAVLIEGINQALLSLKGGEKVAVRAPFRFGKTTVLQALAHMDPQNVSVGYMMEEGGELILWGEQTNPGQGYENVQPTIIVDEAGRRGAESTIKAIEQTGRKVLRVYPGDGNPPPGCRVIDIRV